MAEDADEDEEAVWETDEMGRTRNETVVSHRGTLHKACFCSILSRLVRAVLFPRQRGSGTESGAHHVCSSYTMWWHLPPLRTHAVPTVTFRLLATPPPDWLRCTAFLPSLVVGFPSVRFALRQAAGVANFSWVSKMTSVPHFAMCNVSRGW